MIAQLLRLTDAPVARAPAPARQAQGLSVTLRHIGKSFGDTEVLRDIDLHIPAGQFVAVVGRSGCGKSTLLRLLVGLERQSTGDFRFDGLDDHDAARRAVRIMFQEPRLLPWARVLANVEVGLGAERAAAGARRRALATLQAVDLAAKAGNWPSTLSGGQRQRVALARALVSRPRMLALDEPLGALDALTRIAMQQLLERIWLEQGFTALLVTHDVAEAVMLADRVIIIEQGEIALDLRIDLPRPRQRGSAEVARLEGEILDYLFGAAN
jgi:sulfonate transport system ATP-binding protein